MQECTIKVMMDKGLLVTCNSDDPAYFGGYIADNYIAIYYGLGLHIDDLFRMAENSFHASFISVERKEGFLKEVLDFRQKAVALFGPPRLRDAIFS